MDQPLNTTLLRYCIHAKTRLASKGLVCVGVCVCTPYANSDKCFDVVTTSQMFNNLEYRTLLAKYFDFAKYFQLFVFGYRPFDVAQSILELYLNPVQL